MGPERSRRFPLFDPPGHGLRLETKLGGKKDVDVGITSSDPVVMGSLDKELIRQVIHRNRGQIRYCYESQLTRFPKLHGKVSVKFVISASGSVASSSGLGNPIG